MNRIPRFQSNLVQPTEGLDDSSSSFSTTDLQVTLHSIYETTKSVAAVTV